MSFATVFKETASRDREFAARLLLERAKNRQILENLKEKEPAGDTKLLHRHDSYDRYEAPEKTDELTEKTETVTLRESFKKAVDEDLSTVASLYITQQEKKVLVYNGVDGDANTAAAIEMAYEAVESEEQKQLMQALRKASRSFAEPVKSPYVPHPFLA